MDNNRPDWYDHFDERQTKEIDFAILYEREFKHGTDGHNSKLIIARMAELLTIYTKELDELKNA